MESITFNCTISEVNLLLLGKKLDKPDKYSKIKQEITAIVKESRNSYGYRRVTLALKMKGYTINHKTVRKLMAQMGLTCQTE
ncbi:IS3 family transposase [Enterococcus faecium]|uniref:IS3 family transposase n=1 Tax=Enterococcus faecium TaxID=1352 RepID=UPI003CC62260